MALIILLIVPIVMGVYLAGRDVVRPPARYTISADVLIPARDKNSGEDPEGVPPVLLQGQPELALAPATRGAAYENAGVAEGDRSNVRLNAALNSDHSLMTLQVTAPSAVQASKVLDAYIKSYQDGRRESVRQAALDAQDIHRRTVRVLERRISEVEKVLVAKGLALQPIVPEDAWPTLTPPGSSDDVLLAFERNELLNQRELNRVAYAVNTTNATIPDKFAVVVERRATARITPPPPSPLVPLLAIAAAGLFLAVAVPVAMDRFDSTITEARNAPVALRAKVLATMPPMPKRLRRRLVPPGSTWDQSFRALAATSISTDRLPKAIMVTSPTGAAQDYVAANFAAGLADLGVNVALVGTLPRQDWFLNDDVDEDGADAEFVPLTPRTNIQSPTFPELLRDAEAGRLIGDFRARLAPRGRPNLYVVPAGEEVTELSLDGLPPMLEAMSASGIDVVVIAGPPFVGDANATIIAWSTRHVLWALELGEVAKADAALAADQLELAGVEPFGIALMKRHAHR